MHRSVAAAAKPAVFVLLLIVLWDLAIRVLHVPPYQVPAPLEVVRTLWAEWPMLLREAVPTTEATLAGFALSALFGIPAAMLIASSKTVEDYVYPLLVFSQSIPQGRHRTPVRRLVRLRHGAEGDLGLPAGFSSPWSSLPCRGSSRSSPTCWTWPAAWRRTGCRPSA